MLTPREACERLCTALESGEYKQGRSLLEFVKDDIVYNCCLGVACREFIKDGGSLEIRTITFNGMLADECVMFDDGSAYLPNKVCDWLDCDANGLGMQGCNYSLSQLNDCEESFEVIAKILRAALDKG